VNDDIIIAFANYFPNTSLWFL